MDKRIGRRPLIAGMAAGLAASALPLRARAAPYRGPNVVLIRFGGGVRRAETIERDTHAPWMLKELAPRGTLFRRMTITRDLDHVNTSHGEGTLYILTGAYDRFRFYGTEIIGRRFEATQPTLFEYLRAAFDVAPHQALMVNGEDREQEEFYTFGGHHQYGAAYRASMLSLYRYKTWLAESHLALGDLEGEAEVEARKLLAEAAARDPRAGAGLAQGPEIGRFWDAWRGHWGESGFKNPRGDRLLTELARWAMDRLKPRFLMVNYQDPDYVHWGIASHYTRAIAIIDQGIRELVTAAAADPFYRDNTIFVIVPDCGRDANPLISVPYQHHFNSPEAHRIWALLVGPGIAAGRVVDRPTDQTDIAGTIGTLMGFPTPYATGSVLREAMA